MAIREKIHGAINIYSSNLLEPAPLRWMSQKLERSEPRVVEVQLTQSQYSEVRQELRVELRSPLMFEPRVNEHLKREKARVVRDQQHMGADEADLSHRCGNSQTSQQKTYGTSRV